MNTHDAGVSIHRGDEHLRHGGNEILPLPPHLVDLVGGIVQHPTDRAQLLAGGIVQHGGAHQLRVKILPLRQRSVLPPDRDLPPLQRQSGVHILHLRQRQQKRGFVDPPALHANGLSVYIERVKFRHELRRKSLRIQLDLSLDAVGVDDMPHGNEFRTHERSSLP